MQDEENPKEKKIRILGIDPGLSATGYCICERIVEDKIENTDILSFGEIRTKPGQQRLKIIFNSINEIIGNFKPEKVIIERSFVNNNPKTSLSLGTAKGIISLACEMNNIHYEEISPCSAKKNLLGNGRASKEEIVDFVHTNFGFKFTSNISDAVMISVYNQKPKIVLKKKKKSI